LGLAYFFPLTLEIILSKTKKGISGKIIGAYETVFGMGWLIGPTLGGPITQSFGDDTPYLIFCVIGIGVALLAIISRKEVRTTKGFVLDIHCSALFGTDIKSITNICNVDFAISFGTSTSSTCNCIYDFI